MATLTVRTVEHVDRSKVEAAMAVNGINAELDLECGNGAQYDWAEHTDDEGNIIWSTDRAGKMSRLFFDEVWA